MRWEGQFEIPGEPEDIFVEFANAQRMARHMPGAEITGQDKDGSFTGSLTVALGPKRLVFKGKALCEADVSAKRGKITGQGASDMRAARFKVELNWCLASGGNAGEPTTIVKLVSEASLQGVLADFARTGGPVVAGMITEEFAARMKNDLTSRGSSDCASSEGSAANAISASRIAGAVAKDAARRAGQSITGLFRKGN